MAKETANVALSERVKKLAKDFDITNGKLVMSTEKVQAWLKTLDAVPAAERRQTGEELVALALRYTEEGGDPAATAVAQLYVFAAGLLGGEAEVKKRAASAGGWGPKKSP